MPRTELTDEQIEIAFTALRTSLENAMEEKGRGSYVSWHELRGILDEEVEEFHDAVRDEDKRREELLDILVASIWGLASNISGDIR